MMEVRSNEAYDIPKSDDKSHASGADFMAGGADAMASEQETTLSWRGRTGQPTRGGRRKKIPRARARGEEDPRPRGDPL